MGNAIGQLLGQLFNGAKNVATGADGKAESKGFSRKWVALVAPCALLFSGMPVPQEMWATVIAYILGQSFVDAKK